MWIPQNITNKGAGSGAAAPSAPNVTFLRVEDTLNPNLPRDSKGVLVLGDIIPKPGARMFTIYLTPSKQTKNYTSEGDEDQETIKQKFEGWHPGDDLEINEFVQNNLGVGYFIIADNCVDGHKRLYGTHCSPMKLQVEQTSDNSGRGLTMTFEQATGTKYVPAFYAGNMVYATPFETSANLPLLEANGTQYLLEADEAGGSIDVSSIDLPHGTFVTLIGSGGGTPSTLSNGEVTTQTATVILKDGTPWTALKDASITLQVFTDGATIFLIEQSRT